MNLLNRFLEREDYLDYNDFFDNCKIKVPDTFNFGYDIIDEYAKLEPNKRALVWCSDKGEEKFLSFSDISRISNKIANLFISLGLKKGDVVMTMLNRRWEYWVTAVACHKLGLPIVPATYMLTPKDIIYRAKGAGVKCLISTNEDTVLSSIRESREEISDVILYSVADNDGFRNFDKEFEAQSSTLDRVETELCEEMLIYFTSGTTGYPKMVSHNHLYPLGHIYNAKYWHTVVDDGLHFTAAETGWAKCSWGKIYGQWIAGTAIFVYDYFGKFDPTDLLEHIPKYHIDTFCAPPTIYRYLIKSDLTKYDLSSLSHCSTAGEPLNAEVFKQFYSATGLKIYEGYGQTETSIILGTFNMVDIRPGSMGKACPLYDIHLIDSDYNDVENGEVGEIVIKIRKPQCGLLYQYHGNPELTKNLLGNGYHHTGDLAYRDEDGYYWFIGRSDDIIKSSGYRIGPFEVESALHEHPAVLECAITGIPDPVRGQIIKATVVLTKNYTPSEALVKELQDHVKNTTAPYKYPRIIEFVTELPKTISGKIRRVEIRKNDESK